LISHLFATVPVAPTSQPVSASGDNVKLVITLTTSTALETSEKQAIENATCVKVSQDTGVPRGDLECTIYQLASAKRDVKYEVQVTFETSVAAASVTNFYESNTAAITSLGTAATQPAAAKVTSVSSKVQYAPTPVSPAGKPGLASSATSLQALALVALVFACITILL